jgi:tRNA dimethylallyltransferase
MDIGTAKPSLEEMARVPHHLIDVSNPDQIWSLAMFQQKAAQAIAEILERDRLPFLVGGTGQYIRAVIQAWEIPAQDPDHHLRNVLEQWSEQVGADALHQRLAILDPEAAAFIDARNVRRTIRALEVILGTGKKFSEQRLRAGSLYSLLLIGLKRPREELYQRVDARIDAMLANGLVEEVSALLEKGYSPHLPTLSAIGYREIAAYLRDEMTLEEAKAQMKRLTRRFVRHQGSWFSLKDPAIHWFDPEPGVVDEIEALIRSGNGWIAPGTVLTNPDLSQ